MKKYQHRKQIHKLRATARSCECGLSLIELMVSIALGLLILASIVTLFANTNAKRVEIDRMSRQIENGRYATELLTEEIQMAGYYGELSASLLPLPGAVPDPCSTAIADWGALKFHVHGVNAYVTSPASLSCLPTDVRAGTDVLVVRRTKPCFTGTTDCDTVATGKPYLQVPLCSTETATHTVALSANATGSNFNVHKKKDCGTTAGLRPYVLYIYYISTSNDNGQNVPTLKRAEFNGAGFTVTPLVEGIEDMQLEYGLDTDNNGKVDNYDAAPDTAAKWASIITVRVSLLARNIESSPDYTDNKTYGYGLSAMSGATNFRRHAYSVLIRIQNSSGSKDAP